MLSFLLTALFGLVSNANAFCGTYVGSAGSDLYAHASQVGLARQGNRTTLTLANDYDGDLTEFAMLIPVPEVLSEDDVRLVDTDVFKRADTYSGPRLVEYRCEDFAWGDMAYSSSPRFGCNAEYAMASADGSVEEEIGTSVVVEAEFSVGEYDIVILSAEDSLDLFIWLESEGYSVGAEATDLLQEYIDQETFFLAAKVSLEALEDERSWLSPLQISYEADAFSLPIRLGTLNSPGEQDLLIYAITDMDKGRVAISNYPEATIEDECMARDLEDDFGTHYAAQFSGAVLAAGDVSWVTEYGWAPYHCDPCVDGDALDDDAIQALGYDGTAMDAYFTRLHVNLKASAVTQDLSLYESGLVDSTQMRFIRYSEGLEEYFPVCGEGWIPEGEYTTCETILEQEDGDTSMASAMESDEASGCTTLPRSVHKRGELAFLALLLSIGWMRRR
jgi:hypothetical protein